MLACAGAWAHDFWIVPSNFSPAPSETVSVSWHVGENFKGNAVPFIPDVTEQFVAADPVGTQTLQAVAGDDPAGRVTVRAGGLTVIGYRSKHFAARFDSLEEFEKSAVKEGLESSLPLARKKFPGKKFLLESYSRHAKTWLRAGPSGAAEAVDRELGFTLELLGQNLPSTREPFRARLHYRGKPLEGALVIAFNQKNPTEKIKARTNAQGEVALPLKQSGVWLVTAVHMIPASFFSRDDFESFWASLTFALP